ncbi:MAG: glycoside hydrolase family 5 protein [Bacteroides sp.]|nr:glycoside hydrolase family 5 protein [Bacteroides sp.]
MKKFTMKAIRHISLLLAASITISTLFSACSGNNGSNSAEANENVSTDEAAAVENGNSENAGVMRDITSVELVKEMTIGWNLGDTLDVCQADRDGDGRINEHAEEGEEVDETLWGNVMTTPELFDKLKESGINSVRIPVTWRDHLDENDNIKTAWLDRVQEVVDYAIDRGFYVIVNMHHDGGGDPQFGAWIIETAQSDYDKFYARYSKMWKQIAERFKDYSDYLIFESMNEVGFDSLPKNDAYALINKINQDFVDIIRASGGNNEKRHLLIAGYWTDIAETCDARYKMPTDTVDDRLILSVHYYTPWEFCIAGSKKTWGSEAEIKLMTDKVNLLNSNFVEKGVPVIIGEYAGGGSAMEHTFFCEYFAKLCHDIGIPCFLWDNGGNFDRTAYQWRVNGLMEGLKRATSGEDYEVVRVAA